MSDTVRSLDQRLEKRSRSDSVDLDLDLQPSFKRSRDTTVIPEYTRHEELWFSDGNLVVVSGNVAFKVYRGLLTRRSVVLQEKLVSIPAGGNPYSQTLFDGVPVLRFDEPVVWVEEMLRWIFALRMIPEQISLEAVFAYYELGAKYGIDDMRVEGLSRLCSCYPASLNEYDKAPDIVSMERRIVYSSSEEFSVAVFAARHGLRAVAYSALYEACQYSLGSLTSNTDMLDRGSQRAFLIDGQEPSRWVLQRVHFGYPHLCLAARSMIKGFLATETSKDPECKQPVVCRKALRRVVEDLLVDLDSIEESAMCLVTLDCMNVPSAKKLCNLCWDLHKNKWDRRREEIWQLLPFYFRLPENPEAKLGPLEATDASADT